MKNSSVIPKFKKGQFVQYHENTFVKKIYGTIVNSELMYGEISDVIIERDSIKYKLLGLDRLMDENILMKIIPIK